MTTIRGFAMLLLLGGIPVVAMVRWAVRTPLLGKHLAAPVHYALVGVFLAAVTVLAALFARLAYQRLARWSQARRTRVRN